MLRSLKVVTVAEEKVFKAPDTLTLEEFLRVKRIPPSLFQGYLIGGEEVRPVLLSTVIKSVPSKLDIELRCIRNTDLRDVIPQKTLRYKVQDPVTAFSDLKLGGKECVETIQELDPESAKEIAKEKIGDFIKEHSQANRLIVGISGGGDSNTLAQGLKSFAKNTSPKKNFLFFTIIFEPIWPASAAARASELCRTYKLEHKVFSNKEIETLLRMKHPIDDFYREYCEIFGDNTSHFFGTYLISLVARRLCKKYGTSEYVLGFNREDLLADTIFSLMNGQKPLAFPVRKFGDIKLLMPLWNIPKTILDACYPKYSLSNYDERVEDQSTYQRNIIYYLAHGVEDVYPNLGLSLMQGVQKMFKDSWPEFKHEANADLYISEYADPSRVDEVKAFLGKYF